MYKAGLMHWMEEVSMIPPLALNARPGERILDLCAAPGNKTLQIAASMQGTGTLLANEINWGRALILKSHAERLGFTNISILCHDGSNLNRNAATFDRILCDVPCSCEGTHRKRGKNAQWGAEDFREKLVRSQKALLRKALQLLKVGGRIVYSTCTYAPEENEGVVDAILSEYAGMVKVVPTLVEGLVSSPGIQEWEGQCYAPELMHCLRIYPHQNDTGGFFVATLEKLANVPAWEQVLLHTEAKPILAAQDTGLQEACASLTERFGFLPAWLAQTGFYWHNGNLFAVAEPHFPIPALETESCGLMLLRASINHPKMPTGMANRLARHVKCNVVDLDEPQRELYLRREKCELCPEQIANCTSDGYVFVRFGGFGLGQGSLDRTRGSIELLSLFPKGWKI